MLNKIDNLSSQTRILIAIALAMAFFIPYSYFFSPQQPTQTNTNQSTQAPTAQTQQDLTQDLSAQFDQPQSNQTTNQEIIARIISPTFEYEIDKLGRISQAYLKDTRLYHGKKLPLFESDLAHQSNPKPLEIRFSDSLLNQQAFQTNYHASQEQIILSTSAQTLHLTQKLGDITIEKIITFYPNGSYELKANVPANYQYFISPGMRPSVENDAFVFKGVILKNQEGKITTLEDGDLKGQKNYDDSVFLASVDRYYTTLLYSKTTPLHTTLLGNASQDPMPFINAKGSIELSGYIGPKEYRLLKSIDENLKEVVEYGIITFFAKPLFLLLEWLYDFCGNWGWAIVLLTLLVRIVLYPLTYKGMVSMQKLKEIAPLMKEIQQKYKGEPQKLQAHMLELYKKHGANPMGGCLPLLLQMPVFFAIYRVLYNAIELKGSAWIFWINDLSIMDPYFVLPILMGGTMYLQQRLTPTAFNDPMQEKVFRFLPLIFTVFFVTFPAGLVLYWFVNNIFSILQQLLINKILQRKKEKLHDNHPSK